MAARRYGISLQVFFNIRREILVSPSGHVIFFLYKILTIQQKTKKPQVLDSMQKYCELIGQCDITRVEKNDIATGGIVFLSICYHSVYH